MPLIHNARIWAEPNNFKPYKFQCSCGTGGDFAKEVQAVAQAKSHFASLAGVFSYSLVIGKITNKPILVGPPPPVPVAHNATIKATKRPRPYELKCSCGFGGDFAKEELARRAIAEHFAKLTGPVTTSLVVGEPKKAPHVPPKAPAPKPQPVAPPAKPVPAPVPKPVPKVQK
jgi:hypothetical protein